MNDALLKAHMATLQALLADLIIMMSAFERDHARAIRIARSCAHDIAIPMFMFALTEQKTPQYRKKSGSELISTASRDVTVSVQYLKRFERTAKSKNPLHWAKACRELPYGVWIAMLAANRHSKIPDFQAVPPPSDVLPLIPATKKYLKQLAKKPNERSERNDALVAIMNAYFQATGKKPTVSAAPSNLTNAFIRKVEAIYRELIPNGLGKLDIKTRRKCLKILNDQRSDSGQKGQFAIVPFAGNHPVTD